MSLPQPVGLVEWGYVYGTIANQIDLNDALTGASGSVTFTHLGQPYFAVSYATPQLYLYDSSGNNIFQASDGAIVGSDAGNNFLLAVDSFFQLSNPQNAGNTYLSIDESQLTLKGSNTNQYLNAQPGYTAFYNSAAQYVFQISDGTLNASSAGGYYWNVEPGETQLYGSNLSSLTMQVSESSGMELQNASGNATFFAEDGYLASLNNGNYFFYTFPGTLTLKDATGSVYYISSTDGFTSINTTPTSYSLMVQGLNPGDALLGVNKSDGSTIIQILDNSGGYIGIYPQMDPNAGGWNTIYLYPQQNYTGGSSVSATPVQFAPNLTLVSSGGGSLFTTLALTPYFSNSDASTGNTAIGLNVDMTGSSAANNVYAAVFQAGKVGVGTNQPIYDLDVRGTFRAQDGSSVESINSFYRFLTDGVGNNVVDWNNKVLSTSFSVMGWGSGDTDLKTGVLNSGYQREASPSNAGSTTISANVPGLVIHNTGVLTAYTVTMPAAPQDGQVVFVTADSVITTLTVSANAGQSITGGGALASFLGGKRWIYVTTDTRWYPI